MDTSDKISAFAFVVSLISAVYSLYIGSRDYSKLKTECIKLDTVKPSIRVKAVNIGRRIIRLYGFGANYSDGHSWMRRFELYEMRMEGDRKIEKEEHGRQLLEHDYFEEEISIDHDFYGEVFSRGYYPISLWLEDTTGKKYVIKDSQKLLIELNQVVKYIRVVDSQHDR